jgi:hypothetical protein
MKACTAVVSRSSGAAGDLWGAYDDRRAFRRKLAQTGHVLQPPFALVEPVMVDRKVRAHTRIKAERVGSNPFDLMPLLKELDCLHVKTREVVTALVIQTEKLAGIVHARFPPAEEGDHGASRHAIQIQGLLRAVGIGAASGQESEGPALAVPALAALGRRRRLLI